jgi:hypothetical protein
VLLERNERNVRAGTAPVLDIPGTAAKQERINSLEAALADALAKVGKSVCGRYRLDLSRVLSSFVSSAFLPCSVMFVLSVNGMSCIISLSLLLVVDVFFVCYHRCTASP